jgi:hypothetical protein
MDEDAQVQRLKPDGARELDQQRDDSHASDAQAPDLKPGVELSIEQVRAEHAPLISCIMPTFNRRAFVPLSLKCFAYQDYPNRELIIVDDGDDSIADLTLNLPGVQYIRLPRRNNIGAVQLHRRMFVGDVQGGTLVYRKHLFAQGLRYPETNLAEDAGLLRLAVRAGKRLLRLDNLGVFIYVRHGQNAWREFAPGSFINHEGWQRINRPSQFSESLLASYKQAAALSQPIR